MNMDFSPLDDHIQRVENRLANIVQAVLERGYDDVLEEFDDYSVLLTQFEFKKLVTFQLYEAYFPPKRHEFELQILTDIVETVAQSGTATFLGAAALSGVVGSAAYEVSKRLIALVVDKFKSDRVRSKPFREIETNLKQIRDYFNTREKAHIKDISKKLELDCEKLEPLLKLLGFKCKRRKKRQVWIRPTNW